MPLRKTILATGEVYHIFNRSVRGMPIFKGKQESDLFLEATEYYLQPRPPTRFSIYRVQKNKYPLTLTEKIVTIISFCLMPTHFHFLLKQEKEDGIRQLIQKISNSFAHFFNLKYKTSGPVFEGNFKAVRVENDEQLLHLSRYIHLNPVTDYLVENPEDYPFSSYRVFIREEKSPIIDSSLIMGNISSENYRKFVLDQKDYQRELDRIKHLVFE